jgi:hypothetical protein
MDLFVVPTISFRLLYGFLILHHGRREILWRLRSRMPNGSLASSLKHSAGRKRRDTLFVTGIAHMAILWSGDFGRWAFEIVRPDRDHHGRTDIVKGLSARSDATALTMSWYLANSIFGTYFDLMQNTTIKPGHTYP